MADLSELLERTTPSVAPPDFDQLMVDAAARHQRRRVAGRVGAGLAMAAALVGGGVLLPRAVGPVALEVAESPSSGSTQDEGEPSPSSLGGWQVIPQPDLPQTDRISLFGVTDDGRIVLWGPQRRDVQADRTVNESFTLRGAVFDPAEGTWREIPSPPALDSPTDVLSASVSGNWLSVWPSTPGEAGAAYDLQAGRWVPIPGLEGDTATRPVAQVGDTFLVEGVEGLHLWTARRGWTESTPYPDGPHGFNTGFGGFTVDHEQRRIAFAPTPERMAAETGVAVSGAIYDVKTDAWTPLPAAPLDEGEMLAGGGLWRGNKLVTIARLPNTNDHRLVAFDTDAQRWVDPGIEPLPAASDPSRVVQVYASPGGTTAQEYGGPDGTLHAWELTPAGQWSPIDIPEDASGRSFLITTPGVHYLHELTMDHWRIRTSPTTQP